MTNMLNFFEMNPRNEIDKIMKGSSKAVCGITEREIVVKASDVEKTKQALRSKGFRIEGVGEQFGTSRKIWFSRGF